jgi:hypothetical protein
MNADRRGSEGEQKVFEEVFGLPNQGSSKKLGTDFPVPIGQTNCSESHDLLHGVSIRVDLMDVAEV